jgi:DNA-binding XRE family transcriptional regulator
VILVKATLITLTEDEVRAQLQEAAAAGGVGPEHWDAPVRYARDGAWPTSDFSYIADADLREACATAQRLARTVRHARSDMRLSIREVARRARMPHNTLVDLEAGKRWPSIPVLVRVGRALDLQWVLSSTR